MSNTTYKLYVLVYPEYNICMKLYNITFGERIENGVTGRVRYSKEYSNNNQLLTSKEWDLKTDKILNVKHYDSNGQLLDMQEFTYFSNKMEEYYKSRSQEYIRTITKEMKNSFSYIKEVFLSKTNAKCNYERLSIRDISGKIVSLFQNGKKIL